jgi:hypothetical protein
VVVAAGASSVATGAAAVVSSTAAGAGVSSTAARNKIKYMSEFEWLFYFF